ncbi:MAG: hydroxysqualene dehydroxylase HpnE [Burkholderiaceae bacterium]
MTANVGIVGAGWAGLALAHHLHRAGLEVAVIEASPLAGGRARDARLSLAGRSMSLDNGQHLMIGAYRETLGLLAELHEGELPLRRLPLQFESAGFGLRRRGPGLLGLATGLLMARGLSIGDRAALIRFGLALAAHRWRGYEGRTVGELLNSTGQSATLVARFWRPFCLAALNTPPADACAQTFVNVLHDSMLLDPRGSDFLIPTVSLGRLLAEPLLSSLRARGVAVHQPWPVRAIERGDDTGWCVSGTGARQALQFDFLALACTARASARLLSQASPAAARSLNGFGYHEIRTAYLAWPKQPNVDLPGIRMLDDDGASAPGQWLFDRGVIDDLRIASVVISASDQLVDTPDDALAAALVGQLGEQLALPAPLDLQWLRERRATFACRPERPKAQPDGIDGHTLPAGVFLCGDYCSSRYPATLEGALLSARACAAAITAAAATLSRSRPVPVGCP